MNPLENEFERRFSNAESLEGVDKEAIWNKVSDFLDRPETQVEAIGKTEKRKRRILIIFFLIGLFSAIGIFYYIQPQPLNDKGNDGQQLVSPLEISSEKGTKEVEKLANSKMAISSPSPLDPKANAQTTPQTANSDINKGTPSLKPNPNQVQKIVNTQKEADPVSSSGFLALPDQTNKKRANVFDHKAVEERKDSPLKQEELPLGVGIVNTLSTPPSLLDFADELPSFFFNSGRIERTPKIGFPFRIGIFAGIHHWNNSFSNQAVDGNLPHILNDAHAGKGGIQFGLDLQIRLIKNWSLITGLEYIQSNAIFDYIQYTDTVMWKNNIPGGELVSATAIRTVLHHNELHVISLPIRIAYEKRMQRFNLGLSVGVNFNYLIGQEGKSLNNQLQIQSFDGASSGNIAFHQTFLAYQALPFVGYRLQSNLEVQIRPDLRYQQHRASSFYDLPQSAWQFGLQVGLVRSFK